MAKIKPRHLWKCYRDVVEDFSLTAENAEFIIFAGPSGRGETTTMPAIASFEAASEERAPFDDQDIADERPHKHDAAMASDKRLSAPVAGKAPLREGGPVYATFPPDRVYLFDRKREQARLGVNA